MKDLITQVPIPTAGVALGLVSLGILLQPYSEVFHIVFGVLSLLMVLLLGTKIVAYPRLIREELKNPVFAGVLATLFMTLMQLATYLVPFSYTIAFIAWCLAIFAHLVLILWFTVTFMFKFDLKQVFPTYFIAYVGVVVASLTSPAFGMETLGTVIFWFGFACFAALFVLVTYRYIKHEVPEPSKPLFCIYAAPFSLSLASYLAISEVPSLTIILILTVLAQLFLVLVLTQLPKLLRLKFYPSYAAMTFPFVICANALSKAVLYFEGFGVNEFLLASLNVLVIVETVFAAVMVLYVFIHYLRFFLRCTKVAQCEVPQTVD